MNRINPSLVLPTLTGKFTRNDGAMLGNGFGEFLGQVKIAPDAFIVGTGEAEHGLRVIEVYRVFEMFTQGAAF